MRRAATLAGLVLAAAGARAALAGDEGCGVCHGAERVRFEGSIHRQADISCVACHGGDPAAVESKEAAHSAEKGYRGRVTRRDVPAACGTCHADVARMRPFGLRTDALAAYATSHHGRAVLGEGNVEAAVCTDCHGVHDVLRVRDARSPSNRANVPATCAKCHADEALMERHGVSASAPSDYAASVHGVRHDEGDAAVPTCADCHDAHAATPAGSMEVADVCGTCHVEERERFRQSPHFAVSSSGRMKQCVTCHGNHAISETGFRFFDAEEAAGAADDRSGTRCLSCHDAKDPKDRGAEVARRFGADLRAVDVELRGAVQRVDAVAAEGFYVDDERTALDRARARLAEAIPLTHAVDLLQVEAVLGQVRSLVGEALAGCDDKIRVERDRMIFGTAGGVLLMGIAGVLALRRRMAGRP